MKGVERKDIARRPNSPNVERGCRLNVSKVIPAASSVEPLRIRLAAESRLKRARLRARRAARYVRIPGLQVGQEQLVRTFHLLDIMRHAASVDPVGDQDRWRQREVLVLSQHQVELLVLAALAAAGAQARIVAANFFERPLADQWSTGRR